MSGSEKKRTRTKVKKHSGSIYDISYVRCVNKMFHVVVMQNNDKEMHKKVCWTCKVVFFFLIRPTDFFLPLSFPSPFSITRFYFFV